MFHLISRVNCCIIILCHHLVERRTTSAILTLVTMNLCPTARYLYWFATIATRVCCQKIKLRSYRYSIWLTARIAARTRSLAPKITQRIETSGNVVSVSGAAFTESSIREPRVLPWLVCLHLFKFVPSSALWRCLRGCFM